MKSLLFYAKLLIIYETKQNNCLPVLCFNLMEISYYYTKKWGFFLEQKKLFFSFEDVNGINVQTNLNYSFTQKLNVNNENVTTLI